ncbi:hypothetical protein QBC36DRAFT_340780 [Triangularia setosa]|uniref:VOC domain-containing protein n=1 Tax=Triangularia setosa TaxID=2587417 RepID=A0AAN7A2K1_9PEZI|nr:hypothetical protein QBC36DRAFT_340780 [Podospora setosa]
MCQEVAKRVKFYDPVDVLPFHLVHRQSKWKGETLAFWCSSSTMWVFLFVIFRLFPSKVKIFLCRTTKRPADRQGTNINYNQLLRNNEGVDVTVFFRLDRGTEFVDHHCFFFEGPKMHVHHSSFKTHDFDAQVLGYDWLRHNGYTNCWDVRRHVIDSQIFDYWFDPSGFIMEHYVAGDLLDTNEPMHHKKAAPDNLHVWGPEVLPTFL